MGCMYSAVVGMVDVPRCYSQKKEIGQPQGEARGEGGGETNRDRRPQGPQQDRGSRGERRGGGKNATEGGGKWAKPFKKVQLSPYSVGYLRR